MTDAASAAPAGAGALVQTLRERGPLTRADLAAATGLGRSPLSARLDALSACGLIIAAGEAASTGGRPPSRLAFNADAGRILAIDFGASHRTAAVADLSGEILDAQTEAISFDGGPEALLDQALDSAERLLSAHQGDSAELFGIGIGLPGPVEHSTGRPISPPIMPGWDRFDVPGHVRRRFDVPVLVDNDVNVLALGERVSAFADVDDLLFVKVATGIGAGIISGGVLQRGAQGSAGDLGHVRVPSPTRAGDERDLEALAGGTAIARTLRAEGLDVATAADAVALIRSGDPRAVEAARQAGRDVGEVLATVVNLLNPSLIVLGGSVARAGEHLLAGVREVVYRRCIPLATQHLSIVQTQAGERAAVRGAAIMVVREVLSPAAVDARIAAVTGR